MLLLLYDCGHTCYVWIIDTGLKWLLYRTFSGFTPVVEAEGDSGKELIYILGRNLREETDLVVFLENHLIVRFGSIVVRYEM